MLLKAHTLQTIYLYALISKVFFLKLITFSKIVTHVLLTQNHKLSLGKKRFSVFVMTYLLKFFFVCEKSFLSRKCLVYEKFYL